MACSYDEIDRTEEVLVMFCESLAYGQSVFCDQREKLDVLLGLDNSLGKQIDEIEELCYRFMDLAGCSSHRAVIFESPDLAAAMA